LDPDETQAAFYREHIKKIIKAAAVLGIERVNTFVGRDYTKNVAYNVGRFSEVWPEIIALADSLQIKIGIENCPMFFTDDEWPGGKNLMTTPKIWDELFTIIPSANFGLNYDPSHMVFQMMDYTYPIYNYAERIHHIHLKDVKVYPEKLNRVGILANPLEYHSPKIPGLGDIHWGKLLLRSKIRPTKAQQRILIKRFEALAITFNNFYPKKRASFLKPFFIPLT
jgi:sugar phosphate isomerase/epimerase